MLKDNSIPFDEWVYHRREWGAYQIQTQVLDRFAVEPNRERMVSKTLVLISINKICLNLLIAHTEDPNKTVGISSQKSYWDRKSMYKHGALSYTYLVKTLNYLIDLKYVIKVSSGYRDRTNNVGKTGRYRASQKLLDIFKADNFTVQDIMMDKEYAISQGIELRDKKPPATRSNPNPKGKKKEFKYTSELQAMRSNIEYLNFALDKAHIDLFVSREEERLIKKQMTKKNKKDPNRARDIPFTNKRLKRIFNEDFTKGGRFYGGFWQQIPKVWRKRLTIYNSLTFEQDFSFIHFAILYKRVGIELTEDPYELIGGDRTSNKLSVNFMLNAENKKKCILAMKEEDDIKCPKQFQSYNDYVEHIIKVHEPIKEYFFTGYGKELQRADSDIAEKVLMKLIKQGIVCLPVHDSFVVRNKDIAPLIQAMNEASTEYLGFRLFSEPKVRPSIPINDIEQDTDYFIRRDRFLISTRGTTGSVKQISIL